MLINKKTIFDKTILETLRSNLRCIKYLYLDTCQTTQSGLIECEMKLVYFAGIKFCGELFQSKRFSLELNFVNKIK